MILRMVLKQYVKKYVSNTKKKKKNPLKIVLTNGFLMFYGMSTIIGYFKPNLL